MKKILLIFSLLLLGGNTFASEPALNIYDTPRRLPIRTIYHESGKRYQLKDFKGEFVLLVFWSKSCSVCVRELKYLDEFSMEVKKNGIRVIAISPSREWADTEETRDFLRRYNAPNLEVYLDEEGDLAADFGIYSTPHNVLINRNSQEVGRIRGGAKWNDPDIIEFMYKLKAKYD